MQALTEFHRYRTEGGPVVSVDGTRYIRRTANTTLTTTLELTLETTTGTVTHVGAAGRPRCLQLIACGEAARFPHATAVT